MSAFFFWRRVANSRAGPLAAVGVASFLSVPSSKEGDDDRLPNNAFQYLNVSHCRAFFPRTEEPQLVPQNESPPKEVRGGMRADAVGDYHSLFPLRQLFVPAVEYPLWDSDWDGRQPEETGDADEDRRMHRKIRKHGVTRHIILIRHGQYDETYKDDEKRTLTELGRTQAHMTGVRIAEMLKGAEESFGPCNIKALRVSNLTRAKETAEIIAGYLPGIPVEAPDPMLNEGRPCHTIPGGTMSDKDVALTDAHHPRIEGAFHKYLYRSSTVLPEDESGDPSEHHEFEIIVCHANVIRYIMCRALQLPPETWLRFCPFNCSLTYLTVRPTGTVSCRMLGDIGHLPYNASTFSGHHGYKW